MKLIPLTQNKFATVDDEDFDYLNQWKWYCNNYGYAVRDIRVTSKIKKIILMHRVINKTPLEFETDHIDRNPLNNQKKNLRTVTSSQNKMNKGKRKDNTSGYKGITWNKKAHKWQAQIELNGKGIYLGLYSNIQGAWLAHEWGEKVYFKEFRSNYL